jgi:hypothetical protein
MRPLLDVRTCTDTRGLTSVSRRPAPNPSDPAPVEGPVAVNAEVIDDAPAWPDARGACETLFCGYHAREHRSGCTTCAVSDPQGVW